MKSLGWWENKEEINEKMTELISAPISGGYFENLLLKIRLTPKNELPELYRTELKHANDKLLSFHEVYRPAIEHAINEFSAYYYTCLDKKSIVDTETREKAENEYNKHWIFNFLFMYTCSFTEIPEFTFDYRQYFFSEIMNLDVEELTESSSDWVESIEDYIGFPGFGTLVEILRTMSSYVFLYSSYHSLLGKIDTQKADQVGNSNNLNGHSKELPYPLMTALSTMKRTIIYELLIEGKFLHKSVCKDCFIWTLGMLGEKEPIFWKPIIWIESKAALRELFTPILGTITNQHIRKIEQLFCDVKGKPLKMNKPKKNEYSSRFMDIEKIIRCLK